MPKEIELAPGEQMLMKVERSFTPMAIRLSVLFGFLLALLLAVAVNAGWLSPGGIGTFLTALGILGVLAAGAYLYYFLKARNS